CRRTTAFTCRAGCKERDVSKNRDAGPVKCNVMVRRRALGERPESTTCVHHHLFWDLAAVGPVENPPNQEVVAEVFESVFGRGGHEKEVARSEQVSLAVVK